MSVLNLFFGCFQVQERKCTSTVGSRNNDMVLSAANISLFRGLSLFIGLYLLLVSSKHIVISRNIVISRIVISRNIVISRIVISRPDCTMPSFIPEKTARNKISRFFLNLAHSVVPPKISRLISLYAICAGKKGNSASEI